MYLDNLVVEITRRCNVACRHCLRGEPQGKDIDNVTIDKMLEGVTGISMVTFTGGEPSLAVDRIEYFYQAIKKRGIELQGFYVITNGKVASKKLMHALIDLYAYCASSGYYENEISGLTISRDQYHTEFIPDVSKAHRLYSALSFYKPDDRKGNISGPGLINEGRGADLEYGRDAYLNELIIETDDDDNLSRVEGTVYVNALGDVITSCDMSFESQEENKIGNVHSNPLSEIVTNHFQQLA